MSEEENKGGRPRLELDMKTLTNLVRVQCTAEECAKVLEVSEDTIDRRLKEEGYAGFAEFYKKHSEEGKASIRRAQFKLGVEQMNPTMLVWLGKQHLGQSDKSELSGKNGEPLFQPVINVTTASDPESSSSS